MADAFTDAYHRLFGGERLTENYSGGRAARKWLRGRKHAPAGEELAPTDAAHKAELDSEVDSLLDEIDDVLEVNAEEFVRSFVQKGGQ